MEQILEYPSNEAIQAIVMDFDGTLSTLRRGWETVMEPLMLELITDGGTPDEALVAKVRDYINESVGIQTAFQMQWLKEQVELAGHGRPERDVWWYKEQYNQRLMAQVGERIASVKNGTALPEDFLMKGSVAFLTALAEKGIRVYIASGTDDGDLKNEIKVLGLSSLITEAKGAPYRQSNCSKEAVVRELLSTLSHGRMAVVGDGRVEISIGREAGARTIGIASNEAQRSGIDSEKRARLIKAGAHLIIGDFLDLDGLMAFLGLQ